MKKLFILLFTLSSFAFLPLFFVSCEQNYCFRNSESCDERGTVHRPVTLEDDIAEFRFVDSSNDVLTEAALQAHRDFTPCSIPYPPNGSCATCFDGQIERDLNIWKQSGIKEDMINKSKAKGIHYQVIAKKLYRQKDCSFPGRCEGVEYFLLKVIDELPDLELVINIRDWPQVPMGPNRDDHPHSDTGNKEVMPVFSFSKDPHLHHDILYPAWAFWSGGPAIDKYPTGIGNWNKTRNLIRNHSLSWEQKMNMTFFRGSRTSPARDPIITFSRNFPNFLDAKYTKNQAWRSKADTLGHEPAPTVAFEDHCNFKYLLNVRGVAASFRYKHLFLCNSLVLNLGSDWIEFFYPALKPWVHFIPIKEDFSNFYEVITFIAANDNYAKVVSNRAFNFIWNYLTTESVTCYWKTLLQQYSELLKYQPKHDLDLIRIR